MTRGCCAIIVLAAVGAFAAPGLASFTLPSLVYRMDQLGEAMEAAKEKEVPIAFVYTDESTDCGLCKSASLDIVEALKDRTVMIYVNSGDEQDWGKTPNLVRRAINSPQAGRYIPVAVLVDPDVRQVYGIVPYVRDVEQRRDYLRKVRSMIRN